MRPRDRRRRGLGADGGALGRRGGGGAGVGVRGASSGRVAVRASARDRPARVVRDAIAADHVHGADGRRRRRIEAGETTLTQLNDEVRDDGGPRQRAVTYPHPPVRIEGTETAFLHADHLGSVRAIANLAGAWIGERAYRPHGEAWVSAASTLPSEDHAWLGERYDAGAEIL